MPANPARPLFFLLAKATHSAMAQQVEYLKTENEILRKRLPKNLRTTDAERKRLIRVGAPLGTGLKHLLTIVTYLTFLRWQRDEGRPRTHDEIRQRCEVGEEGESRIQEALSEERMGKVKLSNDPV